MEEWPKISSDSQMLWASGTFLMNWKGMPFKRIWKAWGKGTLWYKSGKRRVLAKWLWEKLNFLSLFPFLNNGFWRIWKSSKRTHAIKFYMNLYYACGLFFFFFCYCYIKKTSNIFIALWFPWAERKISGQVASGKEHNCSSLSQYPKRQK